MSLSLLMLPRILSFSGRKSSGKTELAHLCTRYGYTLISFADALKNLICNLLGLSREELEDLKDVPQIYTLQYYSVYLSKVLKIPIEHVEICLSKPFKSIRDILQKIGTDLIRTHNADWHVDQIRETLLNNPLQKYCISDTRFKNEKKMIENLQGECWFIIRPIFDNISNHISEIELDWTLFENNIIINDNSLSYLYYTWELYLTNHIRPILPLFNTGFLIPTTETAYIMGVLSKNSKNLINSKLETSNLDLINTYKKIVKDNTINTNNNVYECTNPFVIENMKLWEIEDGKPFIIKDNVELLHYWTSGFLAKL